MARQSDATAVVIERRLPTIQRSLPLFLLASALCLELVFALFHQVIVATNTPAGYDHMAHIRFLLDAIETGVWPSYPLYQWLLYLGSGFSSDMARLSKVAVGVLSLLVWAKFGLTYWMVRREQGDGLIPAVLSLTLLLVMPLPNWWGPNIYLGQISPNVWHNPTTITSMPFALALFWLAADSLDVLTLRRGAALATLVVLNLLAKPNYVLVLLPVFFLWQFVLLCRDRSKTRLLGLLLVGIPMVVVLLVQYMLTFQGDAGSSVVLAPFAVWKLYSKNFFFSFLVSLAFPLYYSAAYFPQARRDKRLLFAWAASLVALLQFLLFAESGERLSHANFMWGCVISAYMLFLMTGLALLRQRRTPKFWGGVLVFFLHVATGIIYYLNVYSGHGYF